MMLQLNAVNAWIAALISSIVMLHAHDAAACLYPEDYTLRYRVCEVWKASPHTVATASIAQIDESLDDCSIDLEVLEILHVEETVEPPVMPAEIISRPCGSWEGSGNIGDEALLRIHPVNETYISEGRPTGSVSWAANITGDSVQIEDETIDLEMLAEVYAMSTSECDAFLAEQGYREAEETQPCYGCASSNASSGDIAVFGFALVGLAAAMRKRRLRAHAFSVRL